MTETAPEPPATLDLVGLGEIQTMCGVKANTTNQWRVRGVLPEPEWVVSGSPLWRRDVIVAWAERTGRKLVKPAKARGRKATS